MDVRIDEPKCQLVIRRDLRLFARVELSGDRLTLGRAPLCDIVLDHPSVSREHARLEPRGQTWHVLDNASTNGVLVNGQRVREAALQPGDILEIRPFSLEFVGAAPRTGDASILLADRGDLHTAASIPVLTSAVAQRRLEDLYALARLVIRRTEVGAFWRSVQTALQHSLQASRCVLIGMDDVTGFYPLAPTAGSAARAEPLALSRSVIREVTTTHRSVLVAQVRDDEKYAQTASLIAGAVGSVICAPIIVAGHTRALVYADRGQAERPFQHEDLEFVTAAVDLAAAAAELDDLHETARELAHVRGRIAAGREIQELLLPAPIPQPSWGEVVAANFPAERMSGDTYDVLLDGSGRLVVMLADVSGKGVPAALLTAILQNTLRLTLADTEDLATVLARANSVIHAYGASGAFCTMVLCRWSADGQQVEVANAGHPAPVWLKRDGRSESFPTHVGVALGVDASWTSKIMPYDARDVRAMLAYTDGASEAKNHAGEQFGVGRLEHALARLGSHPAGRIVEELAGEVRSFCAPAEPADDVTLLVVKRHGA